MNDDNDIDIPINMEIDANANECPKSPPGLSTVIEEGMEFADLKTACDSYSNFAICRGFKVRKRSSKKNYCILVCSNEGKNHSKRVRNGEENEIKKPTRKRTSSVRTGCHAALHVLFHKLKKVWIVTQFNNVHNHELLTPCSIPSMRNQITLPEIACSSTEKFIEKGVATSTVTNIVDDDVCYFDDGGCLNHRHRLRRRNLMAGEMQAVINFCIEKMNEDNKFYHALHFDCESRIINVFWVDSRARRYYRNFGDVVTFDTTYTTNKYSMPFALFTGINHHMRSILFGCAILQDESEKTFIWLFEAWLEAMDGKMPISIITNEDLAISNAIAKVFPNTRHRLCLWHILRQFSEKLSAVYYKGSVFKKVVKCCIQDSYSVEDFEKTWMQIMIDHNLQGNEWLQGLYRKRAMWVPVFNRDYFFADMNTTQRSECINPFFDHFVDSATTLSSFVTKFDSARRQMQEREKKEDYETRHKGHVLCLQSKLEEHAAAIYTSRVFAKVQGELEKVNKFTKLKIAKDGSVSKYKVSFIDHPRDVAFVDFDSNDVHVDCSCKLFSSVGILCRHVYAIFLKKDVHMIPYRYILRRWTKTANVGIELVSVRKTLDNDNLLVTVTMQKSFAMLVDVAKESKDAYRYILNGLEHLHVTATRLYDKSSEDNRSIAEFIDDNLNDLPATNEEDGSPISSIRNMQVSQRNVRNKFS